MDLIFTRYKLYISALEDSVIHSPILLTASVTLTMSEGEMSPSYISP